MLTFDFRSFDEMNGVDLSKLDRRGLVNHATRLTRACLEDVFKHGSGSLTLDQLEKFSITANITWETSIHREICRCQLPKDDPLYIPRNPVTYSHVRDSSFPPDLNKLPHMHVWTQHFCDHDRPLK